MNEISTTMKKTQYVADLKIGVKINSIFMCDKIIFKESRTGDHFADVMLMDRTGTINMKIWNMTSNMTEWLQPGVVIKVKGLSVKEYAGNFQITLDSNMFSEHVNMCRNNEYNLSDFIQTTEQDIQKLEDEDCLEDEDDLYKILKMKTILKRKTALEMKMIYTRP